MKIFVYNNSFLYHVQPVVVLTHISTQKAFVSHRSLLTVFGSQFFLQSDVCDFFEIRWTSGFTLFNLAFYSLWIRLHVWQRINRATYVERFSSNFSAFPFRKQSLILKSTDVLLFTSRTHGVMLLRRRGPRRTLHELFSHLAPYWRRQGFFGSTFLWGGDRRVACFLLRTFLWAGHLSIKQKTCN